MARELTPAELRELLAPYALDAVDPDERDQVEEWLERAPDARLELDELRETAAALAYGQSEAPTGLWSRIETALGEEPPALVLPLRRSRRSVAMRVTAAVAAASAVAATLTAVLVSDEMAEQEDRIEEVAASVEHEAMERAAAAAMADPRGRVVELRGGTGSADLVTMPDGKGFLMGHEVPRLPAGRTYQLWAMTGEQGSPTLVSAAILGRELELLASHGPRTALGYVVTDEAAPGVVRSEEEPVLSGTY